MALRQLDAVRGRLVCTCGTVRREEAAVWEWQAGRQRGRERERERAKVFVGIITLHEWWARHRRLCYAHSSLHTHSHKTHRSSFLSSSLSDPGFASVLTLHESFSKEALGLSPAFSPTAVKILSSLFLPPKLSILLGKDWLVMQRFFFFFLCLYQVGSDVTWLEMTSSENAQYFDTADITKPQRECLVFFSLLPK